MLRIGRSCSAAVLVLVTLAGALALTVTPFVWILLVAKLTEALAIPALLAVVAVLVGIPVSMIGGVKLLLVVNDLYETLRGHHRTGRVAPVWRRSLTDTRQPRQLRMLDVVMVISVGGAVTALLVWFFAFSGKTISF